MRGGLIRVHTRTIVTAAALLSAVGLSACRVDSIAPSSAPAGGTPQVSVAQAETEIRAQLRAWDEAYLRGDSAAVSSIVGDEYLVIDAAGRSMSRTEYVLSVIRPPATPVEGATGGVSVRVFGDTAVVTGYSKIKGVPRDRAPLGATTRFTDVFVRSDGAWQPVSTHATAMEQAPASVLSRDGLEAAAFPPAPVQ
jgi:ketosteroid isomerase-like protein